MILVDSSVWIDLLREVPSWQAVLLEEALQSGEVLLGDLILYEVLQGYPQEAQARKVEARLAQLEMIEVCGYELAFAAARYNRALRRKGITIRSTVDTLIAARCMMDGLTLLHNDRDFGPFEREFGLSVVKQVTH
jgi:hypothetical protein